MPDEPEQDDATPQGEPGPGQAEPGLPRPLQEHLGRQLRTTYQTLAEKPAYLGDPGLPPEFDHQLRRLETRERVGEKGLEAVRTALEDLGPTPSEPAKER